MIIGLTGRAGAGKDSVAEILVDTAGVVPVKLATPLYEMVSAMTGLPVDQLMDRCMKEHPIPGIGKSPRQLLQSIGTDWGRAFIGDDVWIKSLEARTAGLRQCGWSIVVTDVRFDNEAQWVRDNGGAVWEVVRPHHDTGCVGEAVHHASEAGIDPLLVDRVIANDGTLEDLEAQVAEAMTAPHSRRS